MPEALDARADVSREAPEEIARLRSSHRPAADKAPAHASRSDTAEGDVDPSDSTPAARTQPTPARANPLPAVGAAIAAGLSMGLVASWLGTLVYRQASDYASQVAPLWLLIRCGRQGASARGFSCWPAWASWSMWLGQRAKPCTEEPILSRTRDCWRGPTLGSAGAAVGHLRRVATEHPRNGGVDCGDHDDCYDRNCRGSDAETAGPIRASAANACPRSHSTPSRWRCRYVPLEFAFLGGHRHAGWSLRGGPLRRPNLGSTGHAPWVRDPSRR